MNISKRQVILIIIFIIIFTYLSSGIDMLLLNGYGIMQLGQKYTFLFPLEAMLHQYPKINQSVLYSFSFFSLTMFPAIFIKKKKALHGEARFATNSEIKKDMDLMNEKGLIIGKKDGKLLRFKSQQFIALGAPTRSGKGVGIVIPNLLDYKESCVVQDIKQECFDYTSKYRQDILGQEVYLFNPFSTRTHRYNPLFYINMKDEIYRDVQITELTNILYPVSDNSTNAFFNQQATEIFIGLCYLYEDLSTKLGQEFLKTFELSINWTLWGILDLSSGFTFTTEDEDGEEEENSGLQETIEYLEFCEILSKNTKERLRSFLENESANVKSSIIASFNAPLMQFRSQPMKMALSGNDFDLRDLRKKKMTIYIGIQPKQLPNAKLILNIFWSQLLALNLQELPQKNKELKHSCLLLMDEFTAIGKMDIILKSVSFIAGYNLRLMTIFQSISQLETPAPDGYGIQGAKTLLTNHACQIFYTPREQEDAEKISKLLGTTTVKTVSRSYQNGKGLEIGSHFLWINLN